MIRPDNSSLSICRRRERRLEKLIEFFVAIVNTAFHARLDHSIAVSHRLEDRLMHKTRSVARQLFEFCRSKDYVAFFGKSVELERADYPLRSQYFVVYAEERVFVATSLVRKFIRAA